MKNISNILQIKKLTGQCASFSMCQKSTLVIVAQLVCAVGMFSVFIMACTQLNSRITTDAGSKIPGGDAACTADTSPFYLYRPIQFSVNKDPQGMISHSGIK
jgi:hypothetical protein